ncbi:MAG: hypothetical protein MZU84_00875 [Sphingobacterium sp.]|nr:hypothetical protein [Sphingobacterium sp.]
MRRPRWRALLGAAGYSPWHAARLFKEITGKAPFEYVRPRRLAAAAERAPRTSCRVVGRGLRFRLRLARGLHQRLRPAVRRLPAASARSGRPWSCSCPRGSATGTPGGNEENETMSEHEKPDTVFIQVLDRPARKMIVKRASQGHPLLRVLRGVGVRRLGPARRHPERAPGAARNVAP